MLICNEGKMFVLYIDSIFFTLLNAFLSLCSIISLRHKITIFAAKFTLFNLGSYHHHLILSLLFNTTAMHKKRKAFIVDVKQLATIESIINNIYIYIN